MLLFSRLLLAGTALAFSGTGAGIGAQTGGLAPAPQRYVAIGCISREPRSPAGNAARRRYLLTDLRGDRPTVYRLDGGDAATLEFHIGHTVEVSGPLTIGANAKATLRVSSLTYIGTTCSKPPAR